MFARKPLSPMRRLRFAFSIDERDRMRGHLDAVRDVPLLPQRGWIRRYAAVVERARRGTGHRSRTGL